MATGTIKSTGWKLLWTNPNPGANFEAQTIAVNSAGYNTIAISVIDEGNSPGTFLFTKGAGDNHYIQYTRIWGSGSNGGYALMRYLQISDSQISFQACRKLTFTGGQYSNTETALAKPFQIFGVD